MKCNEKIRLNTLQHFPFLRKNNRIDEISKRGNIMRKGCTWLTAFNPFELGRVGAEQKRRNPEKPLVGLKTESPVGMLDEFSKELENGVVFDVEAMVDTVADCFDREI